MRAAIDQDTFRRFMSDLPDLAEQLQVAKQLRVPTLVIRHTGVTWLSMESTRALVAAVPDCAMVAIDGIYTDHPGQTGRAIREFFDLEIQRVVAASPDPTAAARAEPSSLRTVLFTDLVGHTEMMQRLGDARGRDVLREHERITRDVLKAHGGSEVKTMGDGFMASFWSVTKAVECAVALQRAFAEREGEPLWVRVGLNAGEPIEEDGDLFGATVILASRIAAKAEGGEILVADTVRGLCSGKGLPVRGPWRVRRKRLRGGGADLRGKLARRYCKLVSLSPCCRSPLSSQPTAGLRTAGSPRNPPHRNRSQIT
jgi:class 3 adenylate cyclase